MPLIMNSSVPHRSASQRIASAIQTSGIANPTDAGTSDKKSYVMCSAFGLSPDRGRRADSSERYETRRAARCISSSDTPASSCVMVRGGATRTTFFDSGPSR
jgi:hypothetical protein